MKLNFNPELIHLYGPFGIQSYGLFIMLGIIISVAAIRRDKRFYQLHLESVYLDIVAVATFAGIIGGRILEVISEPLLYSTWTDWFSLWDGGFSILGSILGVIIIVPFYLRTIAIPIMPLLDLISIYGALLQAIARLGCFTAGCCYGITTTGICGVTYTNPNTLAAYGIPVHPTQLYSSGILLSIFLFMYYIGQHCLKKSGQLFAAYLMLTSAERFIVDFWRAERIMYNTFLSFHQLVAMGIFFGATMLMYQKSKN